MKRHLGTAAVLVALAGAGTVYAVTNDEPPAAPPWIQSDGSVDISKAPDVIEVSGPDGEIVVCSNGRRLKVQKELLFGPPSATPTELRARRAAVTGKDFVWRCGSGANPHLNARLVPQAQDPLRADE